MPDKKLMRQSVELAARLYVFVFINIYGLGKIWGGQFLRPGHYPPEVAQKPLSELDGFTLAWVFFGYSKAYIWFIGLSQVIGGFLLLFNRTKLLGVSILIPVLLNIIVVDYCFRIPSGAMMSAIVYLCLCFLVLWLNRAKVIAAFQALTARSQETTSGNWITRLLPWAIAGVLMALLFIIELKGIRNLAI